MDQLTHFIQHYGAIGMFVIVAIENMGIPLPTEGAYIVGQAIIIRNPHDYWVYAWVSLVLLAGHAAGAVLSYAMGRRIALGLKEQPERTDVQKTLAGWYERYGAATVFGARLFGYVRPWASYVAGIAEISFWPFLVLTLAGTLIFNAVSLALTGTIVYFWQHYIGLRVLISLSFAAGFVAILITTVHKHYKKKRLAS